MKLVRLCFVRPTENWLGSSMNHIQVWMTVWGCCFRALEKECLGETRRSVGQSCGQTFDRSREGKGPAYCENIWKSMRDSHFWKLHKQISISVYKCDATMYHSRLKSSWVSLSGYAMYRVNYHPADLGWVDFNLDDPPILPSCSAHSAKLSSATAESGRQWNSQNHNQPNLGARWWFTLYINFR